MATRALPAEIRGNRPDRFSPGQNAFEGPHVVASEQTVCFPNRKLESVSSGDYGRLWRALHLHDASFSDAYACIPLGSNPSSIF